MESSTSQRGLSRWHAAALFLFVALSTAGCDQAAKHVAREVLGDGAVHALLGGFARFELTHNVGGFLSLGEQLAPALRYALFVLGAPALIALFLAVSFRSALASRSAIAGLALIAGGGLANWLDRVLNAGAVTDFVSLGVGALRTGIFNVADVAILLGAGILLLPQREAEPRDG